MSQMRIDILTLFPETVDAVLHDIGPAVLVEVVRLVEAERHRDRSVGPEVAASSVPDGDGEPAEERTRHLVVRRDRPRAVG